MPNVEINGTNLEYAESGTGEPVVLVHSAINDMNTWSSQVEALQKSYRVITPSLRYYPPNPGPSGDVGLPLDQVVDDLIALLNSLGATPAHLVGHSAPGGFACLLLGLRNPEMLKSLVLIEPPVIPLLGLSDPPKPPELIRLLLRSPKTLGGVMKFGLRGIVPTERALGRGDEEGAMRIFLRTLLGAAQYAGLTEAQTQRALDNVKGFRASMQAGFVPFSEDDARGVKVPTLLLTGQQSRVALIQISRLLAGLIPDAEYSVIPNSAHAIHEQQPDLFNQRLVDFLSSHA